MKWFNRNKKPNGLPDKAAGMIASGILKVQHRSSQYLSGLTRKWTNRQKWIFLYIIMLSLGGMSIYSIGSSFRKTPEIKFVSHENIKAPAQMDRPGQEFLITTKEFLSVQKYKKTHPNLAKERPGLYDSLTWIEQSYYSQKK